MNGAPITPDLTTVIAGAIAARTKGLRVALPGRVETYDPTTQTCTVQPLLYEGVIDETGTRQAERLPVLVGVPVVFPGSGGFSVTWPIAAGDTVLVVFSSSSIDRWLALGGEVDPIDDRRHHISDAIAIPGLRDVPHALGSTATDAGAMVIAASAIKLGSSSAASPVALKSDLDTLKTYIDSHLHTGVTVGAGVSGIPSVLSPTAVGATKVKAI